MAHRNRMAVDIESAWVRVAFGAHKESRGTLLGSWALLCVAPVVAGVFYVTDCGVDSVGSAFGDNDAKSHERLGSSRAPRGHQRLRLSSRRRSLRGLSFSVLQLASRPVPVQGLRVPRLLLSEDPDNRGCRVRTMVAASKPEVVYQRLRQAPLMESLLIYYHTRANENKHEYSKHAFVTQEIMAAGSGCF